ncbi:hypothetical protein QBC38DRAFT_492797 [Podospora fimiseda]|uniref:2EXR domain-containing protein n=1 Tax=Podospora fimiseda TaxID=252190 RepID=A0AAN7BGF8_9PEZI|nr:hypothetical protein QBC38DRAFT_492797 [Podospora fimiseda]
MMKKTHSRTQKSRPHPKAAERHNSFFKEFPIEKLPRELRDAIWEEAFHIDRIKTLDRQLLDTSRILNSRQPPKSKSSTDSKYLARGYEAIFFEYRPSPISSICPESRAVAKRICERDQKAWLQRQATHLAVVISIVNEEGTEPLLPMLPVDNSLIIEFPDPTRDANNLVMRNWRIFNTPQLGSRFLELVLAAKDYQVKFRVPHCVSYGLPAPNSLKYLPSLEEAKKWIESDKVFHPQFISFHDSTAWGELKNIVSHYGDVEELVDHALNERLRQKIFRETLEPLKKLWETENEKLLRAGKGGLKSLPKIDVVAMVNLYQKADWNRCLSIPRDEDMMRWGVY